MSDELYWDPFTPELRDEAPVWHNEKHDFWVLTRFRDIEAAHRDPRTYSSSHTTTVEMMTDEPLEETLRRWREWEVDYDRAVPLYTSTVRGYLNLPVLV